MTEYIYLVQPREFIKTKENIYKKQPFPICISCTKLLNIYRHSKNPEGLFLLPTPYFSSLV